jgi:Protein of unknown function (DUF2934)
MTRSPFLQTTAVDTEAEHVATHEAIALRALEIWRELGCPQNHDLDIWLEAEAELRAIDQHCFRHPHVQRGD